jgi:hypothetical protein
VAVVSAFYGGSNGAKISAYGCVLRELWVVIERKKKV